MPISAMLGISRLPSMSNRTLCADKKFTEKRIKMANKLATAILLCTGSSLSDLDEHCFSCLH
jgi:hypothetical protein